MCNLFFSSSIATLRSINISRKFKFQLLLYVALLATSTSINGAAAVGVIQTGSTTHANQSNTILTFTAPAGTNRILLVTASDALSTNITSVMFGGMSLLEQIERNDGTAVDAIYTLVLGSSTSSTTGAIVMTSTNTSSHVGKVLTARVYENVDQTTPLTGMLSSQDNLIPSGDTLVVSSASGDLVFDIFDTWRLSTGGSAHSATTGQTTQTTSGELALGGTNGHAFYSTSTRSGSSSVSIGWSTSNHEALLHLAVNIKLSVCITPTMPTLSSSSNNNCGPQNTTLSISSGTLNGATSWQWYSGSCGGTTVGSGTSINVSPSSTTTYFVRGIGGCVTPGPCASVTINVTTPPVCQNGGMVNLSCGCNCPSGFGGAFCQTVLCSSNSGSSNVTACNSYIWVQNSNAIYTSGGIYLQTFANAGGCDSVHSLHLTINNASINSPTVANVCDSYTWAANNITYTTTGTYTSSFTNIAGCDSTVTLSLTIRNSSINSPTVANVCDSYTWSANNMTYTATGNYSSTFTNMAGCDSTVSLILTIRNSSINSPTVANVCDSYTWAANNITYTTTGTYTSSFTNIAGCDSTVTLNLTIRNSSINSPTVANVCDSYTWSANNMTYTATGNFSSTFTNMVGCDSTVSLNLTIRNSSINLPTVADVCDSYTWAANNITYTTTGTYTSSFTNIAGCDSTITLNLTVRNATSSSTPVSIVGCYTWPANNMTYTLSGAYTATFSNANSCDSVSTLNLVITNGVYLNAKVFLSGSYSSTNGLMHDSLRVANLIPLQEPYATAPYNKTYIGESGSETISPSILTASGNDAIVDWIIIELRSSSNFGLVVANKRALLQRDGDIVSHIDGISPVFFSSVSNGNYYISIKHRNHLGVMSASPYALNGCSSTMCDFTTSSPVYSNPLITNQPRRAIGSIFTLWSGDANNNKNIKYNGISSDKDKILASLGGIAFINGVLSNVYRAEDCNMDGKVKYNNSNNDRIVILDNLGVNNPNSVFNQHTPD